MKRWMGILLSLAVCIGMGGCGKTQETLNIEQTAFERGAPIVYRAEKDLCIVREDNKPHVLIKDFWEEAPAEADPFVPISQNDIARVSYDYRWLAYSGGEDEETKKAELKVIDLSSGEETVVCDDLSLFVGFETVTQQRNPFRFSRNGDLFYIRNNEKDISTDLYVFHDGESEKIATNVINFYISEDAKKILYTGGTQADNPAQPQGDTFWEKWYSKYIGQSPFIKLSLYDIESEKEEVLTEKEIQKYCTNYDRVSMSFVDYTEHDDNGSYTKKHYGVPSKYESVCENCRSGWKHIDEKTHLGEDDEQNGWVLGCEGQEDQLIAEVVINASKLEGEYKPVVQSWNMQVVDHRVFACNSSSFPDQYNLFSFTVNDGKISEMEPIDKDATITRVLENGILYSKMEFDFEKEDDRTVPCFTDGVETFEFRNISSILNWYEGNGMTYVTARDADESTYSHLYVLKEGMLEKVNDQVDYALFANNQFYYFKGNDLYTGKEMVIPNARTHVMNVGDIDY